MLITDKINRRMIMKKITRIVLAALLVACTVFTFAAFAEDEGRVITVTLDGNPIAVSYTHLCNVPD